MRIEDIKKGVKIRVGNDLSHTDTRFTTTSEMRLLRGKVCIVESVNRKKKQVHFDGYIWDHRDLLHIDAPKVKRIKPITFDPSHLDL